MTERFRIATNLSSIKIMARMFSMIEVKETEYFLVAVEHPFTDRGIVAYRIENSEIVQVDITTDIHV